MQTSFRYHYKIIEDKEISLFCTVQAFGKRRKEIEHILQKKTGAFERYLFYTIGRFQQKIQKGLRKMKILSVKDPAFKKYGKIVSNVDFSELVEAMKKTPVPEGVVYEPGIAELENLAVAKEISDVVYGEMPVQIGYCNGHNCMLNALEYHRDSEINVAATDAILMLGCVFDVEDDFTYDTSKVEAFLVPAGTAVEVYATTLHYAPCGVDGNGFQVSIILPKGTNYPLKANHASVAVDGTAPNEDALITATNKWLIGHAEGGLDAGSFLGLKGRNLNINE